MPSCLHAVLSCLLHAVIFLHKFGKFWDYICGDLSFGITEGDDQDEEEAVERKFVHGLFSLLFPC